MKHPKMRLFFPTDNKKVSSSVKEITFRQIKLVEINNGPTFAKAGTQNSAWTPK